MNDMITDKQLAKNARQKHAELLSDIEQMYELYEDWPDKNEWHKRLTSLREKQYLLEDIIESEQA